MCRRRTNKQPSLLHRNYSNVRTHTKFIFGFSREVALQRAQLGTSASKTTNVLGCRTLNPAGKRSLELTNAQVLFLPVHQEETTDFNVFYL
jgi:hypothetical protein